MTTVLDSCPPTPFSKNTHRRIKKGFGMFTDIPNPIPAEITDPKTIKDTFQQYPFIPYAGTEHNSAYGLLLWLNSMGHLSPTHGACINSIKSYALGQPLDIEKRKSKSFNLKSEITDSEKELFAEWLDETLKLEYNNTLHKIVLNSYKNLKDNGNYFLEVTLSNFLGRPAANIALHNTETVCYVRPEPGKPRKVGISHRWDASWVKLNPPRILPVYPAIKIKDDNTISTMIHIKEDTTRLYGRPDWLNAFMSVYREFQDGNYMIKQASNNFLAQNLIELEDADGGEGSVFSDEEAQKAGFDSAADQFNNSFSVAGDNPSNTILLTRPYGAKEAFVFQFKPNTNQDFYKVMSELQELDIIRAHQWSKRFLGENQTQGFSKDVFLDELKVKEACVLPALRSAACMGVNLAIELMVKMFYRPEFKHFGVTGQSNIDLLKDMLPAEDMVEGLETNNLPENQEQ